MHDVDHGRTTPMVHHSDRPSVARRLLSLASGLVSLALLPVMWAVHTDDYFETPVTIFIGLLVLAFGSGAFALWFPRDRASAVRRILRWAIVAVAVAMATIFYFAAD